jgi:hypothetical protein
MIPATHMVQNVEIFNQDILNRRYSDLFSKCKPIDREELNDQQQQTPQGEYSMLWQDIYEYW